MNKQRYLKKSISVLVFTIPALIPLFVFWVYLICRSVWISFTDWDYMTPTYHFVFLKNYISLFKDTRFYEALLNTLIFTIGTLVPTIAIGLVLAVFLQKPFPGSGIIKFVYFHPGLRLRLPYQLCGHGFFSRTKVWRIWYYLSLDCQVWNGLVVRKQQCCP